MKKILSLFTFSLIIAATFAACGKKEGADNKYGLSTKNNVVYWLLSDISKLIPWTTHDAQANYVYQLFWEPLNNIEPRTLKLIPWLASLPEISSDHKTYTYTINPLAKWSDGLPVTGEDVIF